MIYSDSLLGPEVPNNYTPTGWQCRQGHRWQARYSNIQRGRGCPYCSVRVRKTPADYHNLAKKRGFVWLGPEAPNARTKTGWQCEQGHKWQARYNNIRRGQGCPYCAGNAQKTPADYHALAEERGFVWLGPEVSNIRTKTGWQCERKHQWQARYDDIRQGQGCPYCVGNAQKTPADYHALAGERGFVWLGPEVPNAGIPTGWQCKRGHQWQTVYKAIQQGEGSPYCAGNAQKTPTDYHALAGERGFEWLGPEVSNIRTKTGWQCEQGHKWQARYDDIRRGKGCPYCAGNAQKTSADYQALAGERGFVWLGPEASNIRTKTGWQCERGHQWQACYDSIRRGSGCPRCVKPSSRRPLARTSRDR